MVICMWPAIQGAISLKSNIKPDMPEVVVNNGQITKAGIDGSIMEPKKYTPNEINKLNKGIGETKRYGLARNIRQNKAD